MIEWSLEKATPACILHVIIFKTFWFCKLFISKILQNMFSQKLLRLKIVITIVYIMKFARFTLFYGLTTI